MAELTFHGHACCTLVTDEGLRLMFDPYLDENPLCSIGKEDVEGLDFILCTHGHFDHFQDAIPLAKRTGATLIGAFELVSFAESKGVEKTHPLHIGGGNTFPFGYAKMTPAMHGGQVDGDEEGAYTTHPGGFLLNLNSGLRFHHAGDTALIKDMELLEGRVDVALLPIGDNFTMGPEDAVRAVEMIGPKKVIPIHYNTFGYIEQDPHAFAAAVGQRAEVIVLEPGQSVTL